MAHVVRHTAICICALCEQNKLGAFGPQPDGAKPLEVARVRARTPRSGAPRLTGIGALMPWDTNGPEPGTVLQ